MMTFDGWDARFCGDVMALPGDSLMHFRTRGSKNGIRRYQQEDGTWTPLGLRLRKEREGWGETRKERRAQKKTEKAERKANKIASKIQKKEDYKKRLMESAKYKDKNKLSNLSDAELQKKIQRAKMEAEYKEITKSPVLKTGERAFEMVMKHFENKSARNFEREKMALEMAKINADVKRTKANIVQSEEQTKQAKANQRKARFDARKARMEARRMKQDRKAGLDKEREAHKLQAEEALKLLTWRGSHFRAKNLRVERRNADKTEMNKRTSWLRGEIENIKEAKKNGKTYIPEVYEGQRKAEKAWADMQANVKNQENIKWQKKYDSETSSHNEKAARAAVEKVLAQIELEKERKRKP